MTQKEFKKMMGFGLNLGVSQIAVSSLPKNDITPKVSEGYSKMANVFPVYGQLAGLGTIVGTTKKVSKSIKF